MAGASGVVPGFPAIRREILAFILWLGGGTVKNFQQPKEKRRLLQPAQNPALWGWALVHQEE